GRGEVVPRDAVRARLTGGRVRCVERAHRVGRRLPSRADTQPGSDAEAGEQSRSTSQDAPAQGAMVAGMGPAGALHGGVPSVTGGALFNFTIAPPHQTPPTPTRMANPGTPHTTPPPKFNTLNLMIH